MGARPRRGRPPEAGKKAALRARVLAYALENGVADLSLRPLAEALGTSARLLVYHFGSREGVLVAILEELRKSEDARIGDWWKTPCADRTLPGFLRWYWKRAAASGAGPAARLVFELYALALRDPKRFPGVLENPVDYWKKLARRAGAKGRSEVETNATLALGAMRGLLLDLAATGDRARITRAVERLARSLER
jgi:AcrR family transcriptional regulator